MDTRRPLYFSLILLSVACSERSPSSASEAALPWNGDTVPLADEEEQPLPPNRELAHQNGSRTGPPVGVGSGALCFPPPPPPPKPPPPAVDAERSAATHRHFRIRTVDVRSGQPVAGVELRTTSQLRFQSDSDGMVAFYEPGLMGQNVFFYVDHPQYQLPEDDLGQRGLVLKPQEGRQVEIAINRRELVSLLQPSVHPPSTPSATEPGRPGPSSCFGVRAIDEDSGRGVPLVGLSSGPHSAWTDSQGWAAFCATELLNGAKQTFYVSGQGYNPHGIEHTVVLSPAPGERSVIKLHRALAAERLYRVTGQGIYAHSQLLGFTAPLKDPLLDSRVTGQDTSDSERFRGQLFWIWGDTNRVDYALGSFRGTAATSTLPERGGMSPSIGINFSYFASSDGFAAAMTQPFGRKLPTWINGLAAVRDASGRERLFAGYMQANPDLSAAETGVMEYDPEHHEFSPVLRDFPAKGGVYPDGNSYRVRHGEQAYVYFRDLLRVPAEAEAFLDPARYEVYSAHPADGSDTLLRTPEGAPNYAFRNQARPTALDTLRKAGVSAAFSLDGNIRALRSGTPVELVATSESWNQHRGRFLRFGQQRGGESSYLGEIWFVEGDTPMGPWVYAEHVVTHDGYTFYNVRQHPDLATDHSSLVYFDGTFTTTFSPDELPEVPRYEYNQVMYRLDLADPQVAMPVPVYEVPTAQGAQQLALKDHLPPNLPPLRPPFFALDRPRPNALAAYYSGPSCRKRTLEVGIPPSGIPALFYGLPLDTLPPPTDMVPLYLYANGQGEQRLAIEVDAPKGFKRVKALMLVWRNPSALEVPVTDYLGDVLAQAGPDRCLIADPDEGTVTFSVDGRASRAAYGPIERYRWHVELDDQCQQVNGQQTTFTLPIGIHTLWLEVQTPLGNWDRDRMVVEVTDPDA